ncbi:sodium-coupled neutral amino acid transporter 2-like isoform X2 [Poecilia latipinna]|uniref:sodium-coupled neutral amino acid transporter 2-like isoform X2 n=1 Tax=Poecilia latipinna TaxID=48699 RepID=UPI00072E8175|nr:PREDICTED: sodium-coupled neutral amino acid transporter 2-like isoform X2 [Poecilia latipinna]
MPYAGEDDDSCSSISDDFPCFKGRLDCKKKYDIKSPQESPSSASVSSDEQPDAETDTKHSDSTEDGRHSNCSCCSDESRKSPLNFRREQPLDGQGPNLDAASRNSLHDQNPSKEKESKQHQDDPSSGGTHFNMSNKNMSSVTQALVPRDEQPIAEATVTCLNALPEHGSCSSISNYLPLREKKFPLDEQYPDSDTENQNFLSDYKASKNNYETERHQGSSSVSMSIFNLSIAIMGSGILGLSFAMANTGIALFVILLVIFAIFSLYSVHLLLKTADEAGALVYESLGYKAFGIPGKLAASCSITMQNIGAMLTYLYIIKYELPIVIQLFTGASHGEWYINGDYLVILVSIIVILPLSLFRNLGYLGYTSGLSLLCMVFFLIVVIIKKFQIPCPLPLPDTGNETMNMFNITPHSDNATIDDDTCKPKYFVFNSQTVYAVPIITFAFMCHPTILPMYDELKDRSRRKMQNVANVSFLAMFIMYLLAALFGYLTFNSKLGKI